MPLILVLKRLPSPASFSLVVLYAKGIIFSSPLYEQPARDRP